MLAVPGHRRKRLLAKGKYFSKGNDGKNIGKKEDQKIMAKIRLKLSQKLSIVYFFIGVILLYVCFATQHIMPPAIFGGGLALLILVVSGYYFIDKLSLNFKVLNDGVRRIRGVAFGHRIEIGSGDEFEQLAEGFSGLAGKTAQSIKIIGIEIIIFTQFLDIIFKLRSNFIPPLAVG